MRGLKCDRILLIVVSFAMPLLCSCGVDTSVEDRITSRTSTTHVVTVSWSPNREAGVNSAGGYYEVAITGKPTFTVPYTVTSTSTILWSGTYYVNLRAHAALDSQGSTTGGGSFSTASQLRVSVPY